MGSTVLNAINACNMRSVPQEVSKRERNANPTTACNLGTLSVVTLQSPPSPHVSMHGYLLCTDNLNMNMRMSFHSVPSSRMDQHVHHPHMGVHMRACRMRKNPPPRTRKPLCCDSPPLNQATRGTGIGPAIRPHALRVSTQPPLKMVPPSGTETSAASCPFGIIVGGHSTGKSADIG